MHQRACKNNYYIVTCARESPQKHHIFSSDLLTAVLRVVSCKIQVWAQVAYMYTMHMHMACCYIVSHAHPAPPLKY